VVGIGAQLAAAGAAQQALLAFGDEAQLARVPAVEQSLWKCTT
jgi:hypothetical protein